MLYRSGEFEVDTERFELRNKGCVVEIRSRAFDVLAYLVQQRGRIVSRRELLTEVWNATVMSDSTVPTCVVAIRQALSDDPDAPTMVETVRGRGYRFIGDLTEVCRVEPTNSMNHRSGAPSLLSWVAKTK